MHELAEQAGIELPGVLGQVREPNRPAAAVTEAKPEIDSSATKSENQ